MELLLIRKGSTAAAYRNAAEPESICNAVSLVPQLLVEIQLKGTVTARWRVMGLIITAVSILENISKLEA